MGTEEPQPSSSAGPSPDAEAPPVKSKEPPPAEDYGKAAYAMSRHRKNKVLVWQSKTLPGRVYEFVLATKFRLPGLCSWKCLQCSLLKQRLRKENANVLQYKIPLLLVDNDVIKENPDHPNNAAHFCEGRDIIDATVLRTKLVFYDAFSKGNLSAEQRNQAVEAGATTVTPFELTSNEKETIKSMFANEKTVDTMNKVIRKRKNNSGRKKMPPPVLEKVDLRPTQPRMPVKRMVKLKNCPAKELGEDQKNTSPDKLDVRKIIRQIQEKVEKEKLEEAKLVEAKKVKPEAILTPEKIIEQKLKEQYPPEAFAPITPLMICLDPEEGDEVPEEEELIDVEGVDSS